MQPLTSEQALDRHALVVAIWLAIGFAAFVLVELGLGSGGPWFVGAGAGMFLVAFAGHIIVNRVYETTFTRGELALGLVIYGLLLLVFGLVVLFGEPFGPGVLLAISLGFLGTGAAIILYMILHFGVRRVFDAFDVVRDFGPSGGGERP